jgi:hypothetical protein
MRSIIATVSLCGPVFRPVDVLAVMYSLPASCAARLLSLLSCLLIPPPPSSSVGAGEPFPREYSDRDMADQSVPPNTEVKNKLSCTCISRHVFCAQEELCSAWIGNLCYLAAFHSVRFRITNVSLIFQQHALVQLNIYTVN